METIRVNFEKQFRKVFESETEKLSINPALVEISFTAHPELCLLRLGPPSGKNIIRMVVLALSGTFPVSNVEAWFRSCRFSYNIYYNKQTENVREDMLIGDVGTITEMAERLQTIIAEMPDDK